MRGRLLIIMIVIRINLLIMPLVNDPVSWAAEKVPNIGHFTRNFKAFIKAQV